MGCLVVSEHDGRRDRDEIDAYGFSMRFMKAESKKAGGLQQ